MNLADDFATTYSTLTEFTQQKIRREIKKTKALNDDYVKITLLVVVMIKMFLNVSHYYKVLIN